MQKPARFAKGIRSGRHPSTRKPDNYMEEIAESIISDVEREDDAYESHIAHSHLYNDSRGNYK